MSKSVDELIVTILQNVTLEERVNVLAYLINNLGPKGICDSETEVNVEPDPNGIYDLVTEVNVEPDPKTAACKKRAPPTPNDEIDRLMDRIGNDQNNAHLEYLHSVVSDPAERKRRRMNYNTRKSQRKNKVVVGR
jgi:hypothetical protein